MLEKFTNKDFRLIGFCLLLTIGSLIIVQKYFRTAFPEASIEFKITNEEAKIKAEQFLANRGWDVSDYMYASRFGYSWEWKTFLEHQLKAEEAGQILNELNGYFWRSRWFQPEQKEEYKVQYSTSGNLRFFEHKIPEDAPGDSLLQSDAEEIARFYLAGILNWRSEEWELVESKTEVLENRTDHEFEWKEKAFGVKESTHRITVKVQGNEVGYYHEWLKVPDTWKREYEKIRSKNNLTSQIFSGFYVLTMFLIFITILTRIRLKDIRWKTAFTYGGIIAVLIALFFLNEFPGKLYFFDTKESLTAFIFSTIVLESIFVPLIQGAIVCLLIAGAETHYRDKYPHQIAFRNVLSAQGLKTRSFFNSAIIGIMLTFFFLAYQTVFYLVSNKMGGWSPTEVPNLNALGTVIPWVAVLLFGLLPAIQEESISRMFTIPFLQKYTKSTFFAVFISSVIWGFAHSNYPAQPFYIRGIEVSLGGIIIACVFLRYGILPALIWHFSVDAVYSAMILLRSDNPYFFTTGVVCSGLVALPLIYSLFSYIRRGGFVSADNLVNALDVEISALEEEEVEQLEEAKIDAEYKPLSAKRFKLGFAVGVIGILLAFLPFKDSLADYMTIKLERTEAIETARKHLEGLQFDLDGFSAVANSENWSKSGVAVVHTGYSNITADRPMISDYILEKGGKTKLERLLSENKIGTLGWKVRFFKPLEKKEYNVWLIARDDISMVNQYIPFLHHQVILPDTAFVPSISQDSAKVIAESFFNESFENARGAHEKDIDLTQFDLVDNQSEQLENRTDHHFKYYSNDTHPDTLGDMHWELRATVQGNYLGSMGGGIKLPEDWERDYKKPTALSAIKAFFPIFIIFTIVILWLVTLVKLLKSGKPKWKTVILGSCLLGGISLIDGINKSNILNNYSTAITKQNFLLQNFSNEFIGVFIGMVFSGILILSVNLMWPNLFQSFKKEYRNIYVKDALLSFFAAVGVLCLLDTMSDLFYSLNPSWVDKSVFELHTFNQYMPGLWLAGSLVSTGIGWFLSCIGFYFIFRRITKGRVIAQILMLAPLGMFFAMGDIDTEFTVLNFTLRLLWFCLLISLFRFFWRGNPLSYILGILVFFSFDTVVGYLQVAQHSTYSTQGYAAIFFIVLIIFYFTKEAFTTPVKTE